MQSSVYKAQGSFIQGAASIDTTPVFSTLSQFHLYTNELLFQATYAI